MLHFVTPDSGTWIVRNIQEKVGPDLGRQIEILTYDALADRSSLPTGAFVFAGLGVITAAQRALAAEVWTSLERAGDAVRLLNHPGRALGRADLLHALHEAGRNDFRAYRPAEMAGNAPRYPVFVREAEFHTGSLTVLLPDATALEAALEDLYRQGYRPSNLLVVEYCHTADAAGAFRKYSAFRVGDVILPRYLSMGSDWVVKEHSRNEGAGFYDAAYLEEEMAYLRTNPHEAWLRETFDLARIDYGRIDYGIWQGRLQVWEINTHPAVGAYPGTQRTDAEDQRRQLRLAAKQFFYSRWIPALADLAACPSDGTIPVALSPAVADRLARDRAARHRRGRQAQALGRLLMQAGRRVPKIPLLGTLRRSVSAYVQQQIRSRDRAIDTGTP